MSLPKIGQRLVILLLLAVIFFVSSPLAYAVSQSATVVTPQKGSDGQSYLIIPVSDLKQNQTVGGTATIGANPEGGQVLGITDFFEDIWGGLKKFGESFADIFKGIFDCLTNPVQCGLRGLMALFNFGITTFEKFVLNQIGGEASDCFIADPNNQPAKCDEITAAMKDFQQGRPVSLDPADFGLLGLSAQTTTAALAMPLPLNTTTYLASLNPFAEARATQGTDELGASGVIMEIWKKVRDGSYILLVVVTVIVGFLIMFRSPIGPRAAVTVQNSLPKIAISMLLITFSFLLAGLMLDGVRVVGDLLQSFLPSINVAGAAEAAAGFLTLILLFLIVLTAIITAFFNIGAPIVLLGVIILIVLFIFIIFVIITYKLVSRLVVFIFMTIFAPLFFLFGALPRGEGAILFWFKRTAAALLAIPATGFVISLAILIGTSGGGAFGLNIGYAVPETVIPGESLARGVLNLFSWAFLAPIIGLVLLSFAIKTPDIVDELFDVKGFGTRAGGLGMVIGLPGKAFTAAGNIGRTLKGIQDLRTAAQGAGRVLASRGWESRPPTGQVTKVRPVPGFPPGTGPVYFPKFEAAEETIPPASPKSGFTAMSARLIRRATNLFTAPSKKVEEAPPWRPITRQPAEQKEEAAEAGERSPTGPTGGTIPPDERDRFTT